MNMQTNLMIDKGPGAMPGNTIAAANENRFDDSHMSEPLTAYAVGYPDQNGVRALLGMLFPDVTVPRKFEYMSASSAEAYISELDDLRAIGDKGFARHQYSGSVVNSKTFNKGLTGVLDKDEMVDGDEERMVARLLNHLMRNELRRGFTLIDAAANNTAKTWNTSADPDMDVINDKETGDLLRGYPANTVLYGITAWTKRIQAYRAQNNAGGYASSAMSADQLAGFLGVDRVAMAKELFKEGKGKANQRFAASYVYMLFNSMTADREDPSNCKRFVTPTEAGPFRVYREETVKTIEISVEHYSQLVVTNTLGIRKLTIS